MYLIPCSTLGSAATVTVRAHECLSRQPSLVINIVGPTTLTGCRVMLKGCCESRPWKGGGRHDTGNPPLLQLFHVCHLSLSNIEMLGGRRPQTDRRGRHNTLQPSGCLSFTFLSPPFSGNPVSNQYPNAAFRYWLGLSLVPHSLLYTWLSGDGYSTGP